MSTQSVNKQQLRELQIRVAYLQEQLMHRDAQLAEYAQITRMVVKLANKATQGP